MKINALNAKFFVVRLQVRVLPTLLSFKSGTIIDRYTDSLQRQPSAESNIIIIMAANGRFFYMSHGLLPPVI